MKSFFEKKSEQEMAIVCDWNDQAYVERNFLAVLSKFKHAYDRGWTRENIRGLIGRCRITFQVYCKPSQLWDIKEACYNDFCKGRFPIF